MEYMIDLLVRDIHTFVIEFKRLEVSRPLTLPKIINVPYVTESSRVHIIIPLRAADVRYGIETVEEFWTNCVEVEDNSVLIFVFVYVRGEATTNEQGKDVFDIIRDLIKYKYPSSLMGVVTDKRISYYSINVDSPHFTQFAVVDAVVMRDKLNPRLVLLGDSRMSLSTEFLNRVRMNTIKGVQVYFPIAFWLYKPNLSHEKKPYQKFRSETGQFQHSHRTGHWDPHQYGQAAFYSTDYIAGRNKMKVQHIPDNTIDVLEMFLKEPPKIHVLRPMEPQLFETYYEKKCTNASLVAGEYGRCLRSRAEDLAYRSHLALIVVNSKAKISAAQLGDLDHDDQKPENVDQMEPGMR